MAWNLFELESKRGGGEKEEERRKEIILIISAVLWSAWMYINSEELIGNCLSTMLFIALIYYTEKMNRRKAKSKFRTSNFSITIT